MRDERGPAHQGDWSRAERVRGDHRERPANVVERAEQGNGAGRHAPAARDPGRSDEDESPRPLAPARRELGRDEAAERVAGEVDTLESGRIEPPREPRAQVCAGTPGESRQIDHVHAAPFPEQPEHRRPPPPRAREAVHEHERLPSSGHPVADRPTVDLDLSDIHRDRLQPYVRPPPT